MEDGLQDIELEEESEEESPGSEKLPPYAKGPKYKVDGRTAWKIFRLYEELERCAPERVQTLRNAIAYMGGSLEYWSIPPSLKDKVPNNIPVRQLPEVKAPVEKPILRESAARSHAQLTLSLLSGESATRACTSSVE